MVKVVFVAPYAAEATVRFLAAAVQVPHAMVAVVSSDPADRFPEPVRAKLAAHWRVGSCFDIDELCAGIARLRDHLGGVDVLTGILETLQVPLAAARERLGIPGMDVDSAENFRDKARMKAVLAQAGVPCARNARAESADEARAVLAHWSGPVVVKPIAGMGARNTFRIDDADGRERWLAQNPPSQREPVLLEEFLTGEEFSFECVLIEGEPVWHSIGRYDPTPLTVLENPWIQWRVVLPGDIGGDQFAEIRRTGPVALRALGLATGLSHLEWFRRPDDSIAISEVGSRPPGAQITSLMSWAHDVDMYAAWARLVIHGEFDPPARRYAVGAAYLRAQGAGRSIVSITGLEGVSRETHEVVVESRLPTPGHPIADTYEGDGYAIVRATETAVVERALDEIVSTVRVVTDA